MSDNTSRSSSSWHVMPENQKLFWKEGQSNLIEWRDESLPQYARLQFPDDIVNNVIIKRKVPAEWVTEWVEPNPFPTTKFGIALELKKRDDHNKKMEMWENNKGKLTSFITLSQLESSKLRLDKYHEKLVKDHILACKAAEILNLIDSTHTFSGAVSSFDDKEIVEGEWNGFKRHDKEPIETYSNRYHKKLTKCTQVGLKINNRKKVVYRYLNGLRNYTESDLVRHKVLSYLALVDKKGFPRDLAALIEELQALDQSENQLQPNLTATTNKFAINNTVADKKKPKSNKRKLTEETPSDDTPNKVSLSSTAFDFPDGSKGLKWNDGRYQVFTIDGKSKKFSKDNSQYSGLFKPSHLVKNKDKKKKVGRGENPATVKWAREYKKTHPKLSWSKVYQKARCDNCGEGAGHVTSDCRNDSLSDSKSVHTTYVKTDDIHNIPVRNVSFFGCHMTNSNGKFSKPITEDDKYAFKLRMAKNKQYINLDQHANVNIFCSDEHLENVRHTDPITVVGFGGYTKTMSLAGDHPFLGLVYIEPENHYNILSPDLVRENQGYYRTTNKPNTKEYLYNEDLQSVFTFDRDPEDGFFKISIKDFNRELTRVFPKICHSVA